MKKCIILLLLLLSLKSRLTAQNVGIGTTNPNSSAQLDISSNSKGILIPRLTQAERLAIANPATGLMVYQSNADSSFFWYNGTDWIKLLSTSSGWTLSGNANTNPADNFIGTRDNNSLVFKINNGFAGTINTDGSVSLGKGALFNTTSGTINTAFGDSALYNSTTGNNNTAVGSNSLKNNSTGLSNTANGQEALYSNTTGSYNTAIGNTALYYNSSGIANTANGVGALFSNTTGNFNTANGYSALGVNTTGYNNTGNGFEALLSNSSGYQNTATGFRSLYANSTGIWNTANGWQSLWSNSTGVANSGLGYQALNYATTANYNTGIGHQALLFTTTGAANTTLGAYAGSVNTTGTNNIAIGYNANFGASNLTNATAIGYNALVNTSNSMVLGNNVNVGIGTTSPLEKLHVAGNIKTNGFIMAPGAGLGKVIISDAQGNGTWGVISRIERLSIPAAAFRPIEFQYESDITAGEIVGSNNATLTAPVSLPDGATITNIFFNVFDGSDTRQIVGKLVAYQNGANSSTELASGSTGMAFMSGYTSFNMPVNQIANTGLYSYAVIAYSFNGATTIWLDVRLKSVIITYTININ